MLNKEYASSWNTNVGIVIQTQFIAFKMDFKFTVTTILPRENSIYRSQIGAKRTTPVIGCWVGNVGGNLSTNKLNLPKTGLNCKWNVFNNNSFYMLITTIKTDGCQIYIRIKVVNADATFQHRRIFLRGRTELLFSFSNKCKFKQHCWKWITFFHFLKIELEI